MKSQVITFLFSLILVASFNGCSGGSDGGGSTSSGGTPPVTSSASISASTTTITLVNGNNKVVIVDARSSSGTVEGIDAQSSNTAVFTVDTSSSPTLVVESKAVGSATLNILSDSGKTLSIPVTITAPIASNTIIPQNISASDGTYVDKIVVTWDAVVGADSYYIYKDDLLYSIGALNSFEDTSVNTTKTYSYTVKASVSGTLSDISSADTGYLSGYNSGGGGGAGIQAIPLVLGSETVGSVVLDATYTPVWYEFTAQKDEIYLIQWEDAFTDANYEGNVDVSAYQADTTTYYQYALSQTSDFKYEFSDEHSGNDFNGKYIKAVADEKVLLKVVRENGASSGSFMIKATHVIIAPANSAPTIAAIADQSSEVNIAVTISVDATDADTTDTLIYSASGLPSGLTIDPNSGVISGTPTTVESATVTVMVSDGTDSVSTSFNYSVTASTVVVSQDVNFTQELLPDSNVTDTSFAQTVNTDGTYVLSGALIEDGRSVVYLYKYNSSNTLEKVQKLEANASRSSDDFGSSLAIDGNYIVIGDKGYDSDTSNNDRGALFVFKNDGSGVFQKVATILGDNTSNEWLGVSVAIDGDYIVAGGGIADVNSSVYIFKNDGSDSFTLEQQIRPSDLQADVTDYFGSAVALNGTTLVVSAELKDSAKGAVYIFEKGATEWTQTGKLLSPNPDGNNYFGSDIAIDDDYLIVGESNGEVNTNNSGVAYIYKKDSNGSYALRATLEPDGEVSSSNYFGESVAISGSRVAVGAPNNNAVYIYENDGSDTFNQVFAIKSPDAGTYSKIGGDVALSGTSLVAGVGSHSVNAQLYVYTLPALSSSGVITKEGTDTNPFALSLDTLHRAQAVVGSANKSYYSFTTTVAGDYTIRGDNFTDESDISFGVSESSTGNAVTTGDEANLTKEIQRVSLEANTNYTLTVMDYNVDIRYDLIIETPTDNTITLTSGVKVEGNLVESGDFLWYSFDGVSGADYQILTEDLDNNDASYAGDIVVSVYKVDKTTPYEYATDANLVQQDIFDMDGLFIHVDTTEKVFVKIEGYNNTGTGPFALTVTQQ